jgi:multiple sugar transport system permease protein
MGSSLAYKKNRFVIAGLAPIVLLFLLVFIYPIFSALYISFTDMELLSKSHAFILFKNYSNLLSDPVFQRSVWNTLYFICVYLLLTIILGVAFATFINTLKLKGAQTGFKIILFLPVVMVTVAASLIWKWMYNPSFGVFNYLLGLLGIAPSKFLAASNTAMPSIIVMTIWKWLGINVIYFLAGLQAIPEELYEASRIDGGTPFLIFRTITLPLLVPTLEYVSVTTVIAGMQVFAEVFMLTYGGPGISSRVLALHVYEVGFRFLRIGEASAVAFVLFAFLLLITFFQFRVLRKEAVYT